MNENFGLKEILLELKDDVKAFRSDLSEHKALLQSHIRHSEIRDNHIADLQLQMRTLTKEIDELRQQFSFFKFKITLVAGVIATIFSLLGQKVISAILGEV